MAPAGYIFDMPLDADILRGQCHALEDGASHEEQSYVDLWLLIVLQRHRYTMEATWSPELTAFYNGLRDGTVAVWDVSLSKPLSSAEATVLSILRRMNADRVPMPTIGHELIAKLEARAEHSVAAPVPVVPIAPTPVPVVPIAPAIVAPVADELPNYTAAEVAPSDAWLVGTHVYAYPSSNGANGVPHTPAILMSLASPAAPPPAPSTAPSAAPSATTVYPTFSTSDDMAWLNGGRTKVRFR